MDTISTRRLAGFVILAIAIVVGTLLFGALMASCQAGPADPTTSPGVTVPGSGGVPSASGGFTPEPSSSGGAQPSAPGAPSPSPSPFGGALKTPKPTLPTRTQTPGEPGPSVQIPPPIR